MHRFRVAVGVLAVITLVAAGCAGDGTDRAATPRPTTTSVPPFERWQDPVLASEVRAGLVFATAPDLVTGAPSTLALDAYVPTTPPGERRPAIVVVHGGGFVGGSRGDVAAVADAWARRGYVTVAVDYRLDRGSRCIDLGRGVVSEEERPVVQARCRTVMFAAQHDVQAAIRWVRAHARALGVDPGRVAVMGFSAGAMTAVHVAQRAHDPGTVGDHLDRDSSVRAAIAASGCSADPASIERTDAPLFLAASERDRLVPFSCVRATEDAVRAAGGTVEHRYWLAEGTHAMALYRANQAELDRAWAGFLVTHLGLR